VPAAIRSADADLWSYLSTRQQTLTRLTQAIVSAVRQVSSVPVVFMEQSGGLRGASTGGMIAHLIDNLALSRAWQDGVDIAAVAQACDGLSVLGYTREHHDLAADLAAYQQRMPERASFSVAVRPMLPDCTTPDELAAKVAVVRDSGADWIDFYHYGMMRLTNLDWVGQALTQARL
jgi:hypothetical protein